ncbi:DUF4041 domain-containing protein [Nocardiopsis quinghaiensis]|uniref:DUF4041 domain-containing protein n=1 Tax=Nocardiopsis quinghaiensis TaxID=464995 RepID=UPI001CC264EC|nr:DUF4041 domain-containing protein [Nocardiopsis quinghaiensis]
MFGKKKRLEELDAENSQLRAWVASLQGMEALRIATETEALRERHEREEESARAASARWHSELARAEAELDRVRSEVVQARARIVEAEETALLQEAGVYEYEHPLADAVAYKARLQEVKDTLKAMVRGDTAVLAATDWQVNGSAAQGRKMVRDFSKLMLRAYNAEADNLVRTMKPYKLASAVDRLGKTRETIAKLGGTMSIRISDAYHHQRLYELQLTSDYKAKVEEEKERVREQREQQREEEKARREFEKEKARLLKEQSHYRSALARLEAKGDEDGAAQLRAKIAETDEAIEGVDNREANIRAGYVYVISNIGAFGEHMVKIGMTRRLEPLDRVRELGDASVPFRFDVHALVFSNDAVGLEARLHKELEDRRVNRVNLRREFFHASPADVRDVLARISGQHLLEYREMPEALEWRASQEN